MLLVLCSTHSLTVLYYIWKYRNLDRVSRYTTTEDWRLLKRDCGLTYWPVQYGVCGTFAGRSFIHIAVYSNRDIRALQYNSKVSIRHSDCDVRCMLYPLRSSSTITYALPLPAFDSSNDHHSRPLSIAALIGDEAVGLTCRLYVDFPSPLLQNSSQEQNQKVLNRNLLTLNTESSEFCPMLRRHASKLYGLLNYFIPYLAMLYITDP